MGNPSTANPSPKNSVLVLYGDPPTVTLRDSTGRVVSKGFVLTTNNQASFEAALMKGLAGYLANHVQLATARLMRIHDAADFIFAVKKFNPTRLIYYGHALNDSNALLPALGKAITGWQLTNLIKGTAGHTTCRPFGMLHSELGG